MRKRVKKRNKLFSTFLIIPLIILAGILVYSNFKIIRERRELNKRREGLAEKVDQLKKEKERLEKGLSESESQDYWEERIRDQGYKRPGEEVVVVKREESSEGVKIKEEDSFWESFLAEIQSIF